MHELTHFIGGMGNRAWLSDLYYQGLYAALEESRKAQQTLLTHAAAALAGDSALLALYKSDSEAERLTVAAAKGVPETVIGGRITPGDGLLGRVIEQQEPLVASGAEADIAQLHDPQHAGSAPQSLLCWPLVVNGRCIGLLAVGRSKDCPAFTATDLENAAALIELIAVAADNTRRMHAEQRQHIARFFAWGEALKQLNQVDEVVGDAVAMEAFYQLIAEDAARLCHARYGAFIQFDEAGGISRLISHGFPAATRSAIGALPSGESPLSQLYRASKIVRIGDATSDPRFQSLPALATPLTSLMSAPIRRGDEARGMVLLANKADGIAFSHEDEMLLQVYADEVLRVFERLELLTSHRESMRAIKESHDQVAKEKEEQQHLIEKLQRAQQQLLQSEKMASIGQLAAGVAHEINNPIGYVYSNLQSLEKYVRDIMTIVQAYEEAEIMIDRDEALAGRIRGLKQAFELDFIRQDIPNLVRECNEGLDRVRQIVQSLKSFTHMGVERWQETDVHGCIESALKVAWNELKYKAEVVRDYGDLPAIEAIPAQLSQVFMNLLVNAAHAIDGAGRITIRSGSDASGIWVQIEDTGRGIDTAHLPKLFDPFFTTKEVGEGTGLGLSLSYSIVEKHGGSIEVASEPGRGSSFIVRLPLYQTQAQEAHA